MPRAWSTHVSIADDGSRSLMVASIRYLDEFAKLDGAWFFAERRLMVDWTGTRQLANWRQGSNRR